MIAATVLRERGTFGDSNVRPGVRLRDQIVRRFSTIPLSGWVSRLGDPNRAILKPSRNPTPSAITYSSCLSVWGDSAARVRAGDQLLREHPRRGCLPRVVAHRFGVYSDEIDDPGEYIASPYVANQEDIYVREAASSNPPEKPGLGLELDDETVAEYRIN